MNSNFPPDPGLPKTFLARLAEKIESFGLSPMKAWEYAALFVVLGVLYYCALTRGYQQAIACSTTERVIYPSELPLILLKYFLYTAWPFAIVAVLDPRWRSQDAGNVFLAAYIGANVVWFHHTGCGFCILAAAFRTIPLAFSALLAHQIGTWRHRWRVEE